MDDREVHRSRLLAVVAAFAFVALAGARTAAPANAQPHLHLETTSAHADDPLSPLAPFWLYPSGSTYWDEQSDDGSAVERPSYGVDAIAAWPHNQGAGVVVAVIDSGFDTSQS